jgi:hypothetical protein
MLMLILLILLVLAFVGGGVGYSRWGYSGMSPAGVILVVFIILLFTGHRLVW